MGQHLKFVFYKMKQHSLCLLFLFIYLANLAKASRILDPVGYVFLNNSLSFLMLYLFSFDDFETPILLNGLVGGFPDDFHLVANVSVHVSR